MKHNSEVRKLANDVARLSEELNRPVSSKDLARHYASTGQRPLLLQRLGQTLLKATREFRRTERHLTRIGRYGNLTFYAASEAPLWLERFSRFCLISDLEKQLDLALPERAGVLLDTEHEPLARNALAGFVREFAPLILRPEIRDWSRLTAMQRLVALAENLATDRFEAVAPQEFIFRPEAARLLRADYAARMGEVDGTAMNVERHLVLLKWPQSSLFKATGQRFWPLQVRLHCAGKWPETNAEAAYAWVLRDCLRYGAAVRESRMPILPT